MSNEAITFTDGYAKGHAEGVLAERKRALAQGSPAVHAAGVAEEWARVVALIEAEINHHKYHSSKCGYSPNEHDGKRKVLESLHRQLRPPASASAEGGSE